MLPINILIMCKSKSRNALFILGTNTKQISYSLTYIIEKSNNIIGEVKRSKESAEQLSEDVFKFRI